MALGFQWTLARKVLGLAVLNLFLLAIAAIAFAAFEYRLGPESVLLAPARDRIESLGVQFNYQMNREGADPAVLLTRYAARYDADFFLTSPDGVRIAGPEVEVPASVVDRMHQDGPPRRGDKKGKKDGPKKGERDVEGRGEPKGEPRGFPTGEPSGESADERVNDFDPHDMFRPQPKGPRDPQDVPREISFFYITTKPLAYWAGVRMPFQSRDGNPTRPAVLLIHSENVFTNNLFLDLRLWLGMGFAMLALSALCWIPFLRGLTHSIGVMDRATGQIADGRFDVRIPQERDDEVGHLGTQIGRMAVRLDSFVKNQKRFLGDIAHELCAPIARIQFALGILEQRAGDGQQQHVDRLRAEIQEMSALVNELLSFSKADVQSGTIQRQPLDVASIVERAIAREGIDPTKLTASIEPGLTALANEVYLLRALANVLRNAVRYAGDAGPIEVTARVEGKQAIIEVCDSGPGLEPAVLEQIFEPFYRPEADRSRETGGAGLGLAIVKTCIEACGGTVACSNRSPHGLSVRLYLQQSSPLSPIKSIATSAR